MAASGAAGATRRACTREHGIGSRDARQRRRQAVDPCRQAAKTCVAKASIVQEEVGFDVTALARTAFLPFDHLAAELVAFPLWSEAALSKPVTHLDPKMTSSTKHLWRAAERELIASAPAVSLDELIAMRDDYWFGEFDGSGRRLDPRARRDLPRPLHCHLRIAAQRHLAEVRSGIGSRLLPQAQGPFALAPAHAQARRAWMWLTFALPADLLLATYGRADWVPEPDLISPPVRDLLSRGFAETHVHVGACLDFPTVWAALAARLASPGITADAFNAPGASLQEGHDLPGWLIRAAIARLALSWFLASTRTGPFLQFLHGTFRDAVYRRAGHANFSLVISALVDLHSGALSNIPLPDLCGVYAELVGSTGSVAAVKLAKLRGLDPIDAVLRPGPGTPEQRYVVRMTEYLDRREAAGSADDTAAILFWQTVRARVLLYRYLTQRPLTPGLPWFIRFYRRMSTARGAVPQLALIEAAELTSGIREGMTSLEVRTSPEPQSEQLRIWARTLAERSAAFRSTTKEHKSSTELGMVFHFLKERGGEVSPGTPRVAGAGTHADPGAGVNAGRFRFSHYFSRQRAAAHTLARLLHRWPKTQFIIRGLDVCADELAVPTWVMCPLLSYVRRAASEGTRYLRRRGLQPPPPLRITVHAGEDFAHLLTGLRHIHEAIEMLDLREGDRIGHGLALGVDPKVWAARAGRAAMPLQDRVFDLAWEWSWWTRRGGGLDAARLAYLARNAADLAEHWFGVAVDIRQVERLRSDLTDPDQLARAGFPDRPGPEPPTRGDRNWILDRYLRDQQVFKRGMATLLVDPSAEMNALTQIGISLREEVGRRGLAIEINPTSNLLIGDLTDLENHPLWRLAPPRPRPDLPPLAVTVGSDDPLVFNCRLPGEYQLLFDALLLAGLTDLETMDWLDRVRRNGLERRFTTPFASTAPGGADPFDIENLTELDPPLL
jgi:hypothetical protein